MALSDDISTFTNLASRHEVLKKDKEKELIRLAQQNPPDKHAWDLLVKHNIKLVISIAKRYLNQGLTFEDLIQEGLIGLCIAIQKFDFRGALSTYATWWIRQAITRAIDNTSRAIRIPIHRQNEYRTVKRVYREFVERFGDLPSSEELCILVKKASEKDPKLKTKELTKEDIEFLGRMFHPQVYLDAASSEDENLTMLDYLSADCETQPETQCESIMNKQELIRLVRILDEDDRIFILLKFGIIDGKERDKKEMSAYRRMSEEDAQKKINDILLQLRAFANRDRLNLD